MITVAEGIERFKDQGKMAARLPAAMTAECKELNHKFAVIDNKTVITGSFNWSPTAAHTNDETLLVIHSPQLAKHFTQEMNRMWRSAELGITPRIQHKLDRQRAKCGSGFN